MSVSSIRPVYAPSGPSGNMHSVMVVTIGVLTWHSGHMVMVGASDKVSAVDCADCPHAQVDD